MRITIILGPFYPVPTVLGGAVEKVHLLLATAYKAAGHDVSIVSRRYKDFPDEEVVDGVKHVRIASSDRSSSLALNLLKDFCYSLRVRRSLRRSDISITNSFFLPLLLRRRTAGKIYVQVGRYPKRQMFLYARADRIQAVSREVATEIVRQTPGLSHKVVTIGYAIPDAYFCPEPIASRPKTLLYVGRIAREKGVHLLVRAFSSLRQAQRQSGIEDWKLRIVGPHAVTQGGDGDEYMAELISLARPLGVACDFAGPIFDQKSLIEEYRSASVFVYPSLAEKGESFGLAPLEAMAGGCAAVVSNLRCFDDYIEHGATGLVFDHRSAHPEKALAEELSRLISGPGAIEEIANRGRKAADRFCSAAIAAKMLHDFEAVVGASGDPDGRPQR